MTKRKKTKPHPDLLFRYGYILFIFFFLMALWAFWTSYYGVLSHPIPRATHLHGIAMTLWVVMLIGQAALIRLKQHKIHRWTGRLSYLLVPFILYAGANLAFATIRQSEPGTNSYYFAIALMFNSLVVFAILYALAIWYRKTPAIHARYMACTLLPAITPVTDRLIYKYFPSLIQYAPRMEDGMPMVPGLGFFLGDIILILLSIWDWKANKRWSVFPVVLVLLLIYHISVLTFYKYPFWQKIGDWIMN